MTIRLFAISIVEFVRLLVFLAFPLSHGVKDYFAQPFPMLPCCINLVDKISLSPFHLSLLPTTPQHFPLLRPAAAFDPAASGRPFCAVQIGRVRHHVRRGLDSIFQAFPPGSGTESMLLFLRRSTDALGSSENEEQRRGRRSHANLGGQD